MNWYLYMKQLTVFGIIALLIAGCGTSSAGTSSAAAPKLIAGAPHVGSIVDLGRRHMAKQEHIDILMRGVEAWNQWRSENPGIAPCLSGVDLRRMNLSGADLREADLSGARLVEVNLARATLARADLRGAYVSESNLAEADLREAKLTQATLSRVNLGGADLRGAELTGTKLSQVNLRGAILPEGFKAS